jgi:hypothetical protein
MRVNVYSQELTDDVELLCKIADTGVAYHAVRLFLISPKELHNTPEEDDRSAVTIWLPKSRDRREELARTFEELARLTRAAPPESGMD